MQRGPAGRGSSRRRRRAAGWALALVLALVALPGCRRAAEDGPEAAPTLAATAAPLATAPASPTAAPTVAPAATPTPAPSPTPCGFAVLPALQAAYLDIELGCPLSAGQEPINTAYAPFAGGQMLWRSDNAQIYVLYNDGRWAQYDDLWREGEAEFTCGQPSNPPTPLRGFGRVWCDHPEVRQGLGDATAAEIGDAGGQAQDFVNGLLLAGPDGSTFVLVGETATWRRVWPDATSPDT